jgi:ribosomal protein S18 acetylase RimI-like enzyme
MTGTSAINKSSELIANNRGNSVRAAVHSDVPGIVAIHRQSFSNFFLTRLGGSFLSRYYGLVLDYWAGIILVAERRGALQGFICGFVEPAEFYKLMWRSKFTFAMPALSALIHHPSLAAGILQGVRRIQASAVEERPRSCELSSIAVLPAASGNGLGKALLKSFTNRARSMDAQCIYLTTDADNNESANTLYRQAGFRQTHCFLQRKGRWMNEYVIDRMGESSHGNE